jgi:uncharacterized small protein (DUF1192 family)
MDHPELMRLHAREGELQPVYLDIEVSERLRTKINGLSASQRLELAMRAPAALELLVDGIAHVADLSPLELQQRFTHAQREIEALAAERRRRQQCEECGVAREHGHLFGCERALEPSS